MGAEFYGSNETTLMNRNPLIPKKYRFLCNSGGRGGSLSGLRLSELHIKLFNQGFNDIITLSADVEATSRCFLELIRLKLLSVLGLMMNTKKY